MTRQRLLDWTPPVIVFIAMLGLWEFVVWFNAIPPYVLPAPSLIALTLISATGILIFLLFSALSWALLSRWHDSARDRGG